MRMIRWLGNDPDLDCLVHVWFGLVSVRKELDTFRILQLVHFPNASESKSIL